MSNIFNKVSVYILEEVCYNIDEDKGEGAYRVSLYSFTIQKRRYMIAKSIYVFVF